jgi:uncharacterized protein (DUF1499 family)
MLKRLIACVLIIAVILAVLGIIVVLYGREKSWEALFGSPDLGPVTFATLIHTSRPNQALLCPPDLCKEAQLDMIPPVYAVSVDDLHRAFRRIIAAEPRSERVDENTLARTERYVIRTKLMRFPDTIRVQFVDLGSNTSTLAIHSQAQIGYSDYGVNRARIQRWLKALDALPKD